MTLITTEHKKQKMGSLILWTNVFKYGHADFLYLIGFGKETISIGKNKFDKVPLFQIYLDLV